MQSSLIAAEAALDLELKSFSSYRIDARVGELIKHTFSLEAEPARSLSAN